MIAAPALREVRLYGPLGKQFGRLFRLDVRTAAEAVRALCAVLPGFRRAFVGRASRARYHVFVGRGAKRVDIGQHEVDELVGRDEPIRIVPVVEGAKRGGALQTIIGLVLVVVGVLFNNPALIQMGATMMLGGVVQMLAPQRTSNGKSEDDRSYGFDDGPQNSTDAGGPVPIIYGRVFAGSVVVSGGLSTVLEKRDELSGEWWLGVGTPPTPKPLPGDQQVDPQPYLNTADGGD